MSQIIREAYRNGKNAAWLPATDWEAMLEESLAEVRAEPALLTRRIQGGRTLSLAAERAFKAMRRAAETGCLTGRAGFGRAA